MGVCNNNPHLHKATSVKWQRMDATVQSRRQRICFSPKCFFFGTSSLQNCHMTPTCGASEGADVTIPWHVTLWFYKLVKDRRGNLFITEPLWYSWLSVVILLRDRTWMSLQPQTVCIKNLFYFILFFLFNMIVYITHCLKTLGILAY